MRPGQGLLPLEKAPLVCSLLLQAPPGEFAQVVQDLRALVHDEELLRREAARVGAWHSKNHFPPVQINEHTVLVTRYNDLGGNRFFDPQDKLSFAFYHLSGVASEYRLHDVLLDEGELQRGALHKGLKEYVSCHFPTGNCCVFRKNARKTQIFVACIEAHQYQPSGCWNGLWKSDWTLALTPVTTQVTGIFLLQMHYFNGANLHVTVSKSVSEPLNVTDQSQLSIDFVKLVKAEDTKLHMAILENMQALSEDIWGKNLRRKLPITRTFINWNRLLNEQPL
ncbi:F-actin-capping protein subunit alpha-3 [Rhea pennata]|uniref:F-actin-capping protein subunit alpha-3 n=1 Tax=Rhea pennata TaxID=8795 RepID=UPI002E25F5DE